MNSLVPLNYNRREVQAGVNLFGGKALTDETATEVNFREQMSQYRIIHLAMHGMVNDDYPSYSGLVFNAQDQDSSLRDGVLFASEIHNLELNADLVVLSACNTGIGKLYPGEGMMSLARAFRSAGCPNLAMTLWQADDQSTAAIVESFYQYLRKGFPKDKALQQAKLDYLSQNDQAHPHYWAAMILMGDAEAMYTSPRQRMMGYAILAVLVILASILGYTWLRKRA